MRCKQTASTSKATRVRIQAVGSIQVASEGIQRRGFVGGPTVARESAPGAANLKRIGFKTTPEQPLAPPSFRPAAPTLASLAPCPFPRVPSPASWHHRPSQPVRPGLTEAARLASDRRLTGMTRPYWTVKGGKRPASPPQKEAPSQPPDTRGRGSSSSEHRKTRPSPGLKETP